MGWRGWIGVLMRCVLDVTLGPSVGFLQIFDTAYFRPAFRTNLSIGDYELERNFVVSISGLANFTK